MNENTGLNIALGINMKIISSACNAAADKFGVVLEINRENRFAVLRITPVADCAVNMLSLLGGEQQGSVGICANGHIVKIPHVFCTRFNHFIVEFIACYGFIVCRGIANRGAEKAAVLFKHFHGVHRCLVSAVAASAVVRFLCALYRKREAEVAAFYKLFAKFIVNQRCVSEREKHTVGIFLCKRNYIFFLMSGSPPVNMKK